MSQELKNSLSQIYTSLLKPLMPTLVLMLVLLIVAGVSIFFMGANNPIEQDIEKIIEADLAGITSS